MPQVAFTRILHRSTDDALSPVIPTFRANPLHPGGWGGAPRRAPRAAGPGARPAQDRAAHRAGGGSAPVDPQRASLPSLPLAPPPCPGCGGWCDHPGGRLTCSLPPSLPPLHPLHNHVNENTAECDAWCDYPVADRPNAVRQFLDAAARDPGMVQVGGRGERMRLDGAGQTAGLCTAPPAR